ncbi:hypothetical protein [Streptomyces sp. NPDC012466]
MQWEIDAHEAVLAGRRIVQGLTGSVDPEIAEAAGKLLDACDAETER